MKPFEEMTFKEVIEHLSSVYMNADKHVLKCDICKKVEEILSNYRFSSLRKLWDYDD